MKRRPPGRNRSETTLPPPADVGEPAERPDAGEDEVEPAGTELVHGGVDVRLDELDLARRLLRELPRLRQGGAREVEARHASTEPRERDRVCPDVALQVHAFEAGDVTEER